MSALRVVLGDQLSPNLSALEGLAPGDVVLLAEVLGECTYVPHHKRKIVLVLSAMRHFAAALESRKITVRYIKLDDPENTQTLTGEVARAVADLRLDKVIATEPGEWRVREGMRGWADAEIRPDTRFAAPDGFFGAWARGKTTLRMEFFYREMRRHHGILMEGDQPVGNKWNFDAENRKKLPAGITPPAPKRFPPDAITNEVLALVAARFQKHPGSLDGFDFPVTAKEAKAGFQDFLKHRLAGFGDWQDSMAADEPFMFHALVSAPLNLGLLDPLWLCREAEAAYHAGAAPLNAVEGFIRQILGWREYIRGIYWHHMPDYGSLNALTATRKLPAFYWTADTNMRCMAQAIGQTLEHAYAHHIHRLMITGNFALLAGLHPDQVDEWYLAVYADAYEWVEMPNTRGMALHADGGIVGSKPYAASGAYINKMSDYCSGCFYDVKDATGPRACPFNALYWDFIARHAEKFEKQPAHGDAGAVLAENGGGEAKGAPSPRRRLAHENRGRNKNMTIPTPADGIAWVTGASSGIGREVAAQLAQAGWTVAISARRAPDLESLAAEHPGKMIVAPLDITDQDAVAAAVTDIESRAGLPIMRAILNAGTYLRDTGTDFDVARFKVQVDVNLVGTANCIAPLLPRLLAAKRGQIGIVGSLAGLSGLPGSVTYSTTKAGLIAMAQSLNFDCRKAGVGMSMILPGFVKTPLTDKNTIPMPYLMEVKDAARDILKGLDAGRFIIAFPGPLAWPLRFLRILPAPLYFALVAKGTKW